MSKLCRMANVTLGTASDRLNDLKTKGIDTIYSVIGMKNEEIVTRELWRFEENEDIAERVAGNLKKVNDLLNVSKLRDAGLFNVYRENFIQK